MLKNPKTTIAGYGTLLSAIVYVGYQLYSGQSISMQDFLAIAAAAGGVGLIGANDGGH